MGLSSDPERGLSGLSQVISKSADRVQVTHHFILAFKTLITYLLMCKANIFLSPCRKRPCLEDQPGLSVSAAEPSAESSHIMGLSGRPHSSSCPRAI